MNIICHYCSLCKIIIIAIYPSQGGLDQHLEPLGRGLEEFAEAVYFLRWVQQEEIESLDSYLFQGLSLRELLGKRVTKAQSHLPYK